ncbi:homeobox protein notochord-like [Ranitomeya imitator]|uniref:homeobox protein notochord-like n=1 Tax=Ranitomeya imitator TaxID=111125 RepID=UPI0037E8B887
MQPTPIFSGLGHHLAQAPALPAAIQDQTTPKKDFDIDSLLSREDRPAPRVIVEEPGWQMPPAPHGYSYGAMSYPPVFLCQPAAFPGYVQPQQHYRPLRYMSFKCPIESVPCKTGPSKLKRIRTVFTPEQLEKLEKDFLKQQIEGLSEGKSLEQKNAKLSQFGVLPKEPPASDTREIEGEDEVDVDE